MTEGVAAGREVRAGEIYGITKDVAVGTTVNPGGDDRTPKERVQAGATARVVRTIGWQGGGDSRDDEGHGGRPRGLPQGPRPLN